MIISFKQFLLEKIKPNATAYGTDLHNRVWFKYETDIRKSVLFWKKTIVGEFFYITFFEHDGRYYSVSFNKLDGYIDVSFNSAVRFEPDVFVRIKNPEHMFFYLNDRFSFNLVNTSQAQTIFSKVFYVILQGCKELGIDSFQFSPADNSISGRLKKFYESYFLSDGNIRLLDEQGLIFVGKRNSVFLFKVK